MRVKFLTIVGVLAIFLLVILFFMTSSILYKSILIFSIVLFSLYVLLISRYINCVEDLKEKILVQHSQLKTIIDDTSFITLLCGVDGTILLANKNFTKIFDLNSDDIVGSSLALYCDKNKLQVLEDENQYVVKNKTSLIVDREICLQNVKGWYRVMKYPVFDKDGNVIRIISLNKNIDKEKDIEDRKNTFVATLIHDLKTPTIAQIKTLDLLLNENFGCLEDKQREILLQIKKSCSYMSDLVFSILDTYLYDNGNAQIYQEEFSLSEIVMLTVSSLSNLYKEKNQKIKIHADSNTKIFADKFQIQRVITNLLSNAINYGFNNSNIDIFIKEKDSYIAFDIQNHSPYISKERLVDIFDKYKSIPNTKFYKTGTGLGLYLSKQIIDAHNGEIHAYSREDETCTFGFSVPKP